MPLLWLRNLIEPLRMKSEKFRLFVNQERIHLEWMPVTRAHNGAVLDGPADRVAIPAIQVFPVEQERVALLLFLRNELVVVGRRGGAGECEKDDQLHDFITSSQVTSRCRSMAMRPM